jgi:hypothetical protein
MSYEVECGECSEQILIEDLGVEVACPHCETVLILNAEDVAELVEEEVQEDVTQSETSETTDEQQAFDFNFTDSANVEQTENGSDSGVASAILTKEEAETADEEASAENTVQAIEPPNFDFLNQGAPESASTDETAATEEEAPNFNFTDPVVSETTTTEETKAGEAPTQESASAEEEAPSFNFADPVASETAAPEESKTEEAPSEEVDPTDETPATEVADAPGFSLDTSEASDDQEAEVDETVEATDSETDQEVAAVEEEVEEETNEESTTEPVGEKPISDTGGYSRRSRGPSPKVFQILVSYSILITIAFLYLFFSFFQAKPHQLESLPDIAPAEEGEFRLIRENASLAPGHTLQIGETQRFGNIEVTPLGVVRGSLEFEHFQGALGNDVPPTRPVYKLKLKIKNVSDDQVFAPLDTDLLALREHDPKDYDRVYANSWVCKASNLGNRENRVLMYNHPPTSEFDIKGFIARPLTPGEEVETFLPTVEEGLGVLEGNLVWRFLIRKGFHPSTMNGVTTLVEVSFSSDSISKEAT